MLTSRAAVPPLVACAMLGSPGLASARRESGVAAPPTTPNRRPTCRHPSADPREMPPCALGTWLIRSNAFAASGIRGQHRWDRRQRGRLVDQQHQELLAHQRLERRECNGRQLLLRLADTAHQFETTFVNRIPAHADIEDRPDHGLAQPAGRNTGLQLGDTLMQQFLMERSLPSPFATGASPSDRHQTRSAALVIHRSKGTLLGHHVAPVAPCVERLRRSGRRLVPAWRRTDCPSRQGCDARAPTSPSGPPAP